MDSNDRRTISDYNDEQSALVHSTCLHVATVLADLMEEEITIVGGIVPSLLVDQEVIVDASEKHPGTLDLDIVLSVVLLEDERYAQVSERLRQAGFSMDVNWRQERTRQRWCYNTDRGVKALVDFLIPPTSPEDRAGKPKHLEADFSAIVMDGLELSFADREMVTISGKTLFHESVERRVGVCGAGAFIILKALALGRRGYGKDAYDLYYMLQKYSGGIEEISRRINGLPDHAVIPEAINVMKSEFAAIDSTGPTRAALFTEDMYGDEFRADVLGAVQSLLRSIES